MDGTDRNWTLLHVEDDAAVARSIVTSITAMEFDVRLIDATTGREVGPELVASTGGPAVYVRVNSILSDWFVSDIDDGLCEGLAGILVPKLERSDQVAAVADALIDAGHGDVRTDPVDQQNEQRKENLLFELRNPE